MSPFEISGRDHPRQIRELRRCALLFILRAPVAENYPPPAHNRRRNKGKLPVNGEVAMIKALQPLAAVGAAGEPSPACKIPAVARCCEAWQRAYDDEWKKDKCDFLAREAAGEAYRNVMPPLSDTESIRDFVICAAHGLLLKAIEEKTVGKLIYAAQFALSAVSSQSKSKAQGA
jgi:hypothetical protein